ncbi:MAG: ankyrin repeat domain-containing protein [Armatimonadetes bacterium]|nr:ankyrin repeat domain-containing protein [Armatimonadota bacterium]
MEKTAAMFSRESQLLKAIRDDKLKTVERLLKAGTSPDAADARGTALAAACRRGDLAVVKLLLQAGASPDKPGEQGSTPLMDTLSGTFGASNQTLAAIMGALVESGADPNASDEEGNTPMLRAARGLLGWAPPPISGLGERAKALAELGGDPDRRRADGNTALMLATYISQGDDVFLRGPAESLVEALVSIGASAEGLSSVLLIRRAELGPTQGVQQALEAGADPNHTLPDGVTPLYAAARTGAVEAVELLLKAGARVTGPGLSPLVAAAESGNQAMVQRLVEAGADPAVLA